MSELIIKIKGPYNNKNLISVFNDILVLKPFSNKNLYLEYKI